MTRRAPPSLNRRALLRGTAAMGGVLWSVPRARAQAIRASQYHPQPEDSHLQTYLTQLWNAVRRETSGRLDVTVHPRNRDVAFAEPEILKLVINGELEFFVLNGNILSQAHPVADIQGIPFAFKADAQVDALNDGAFGDLLRAELIPAGVYLIPYGAMENGFKHITAVDRPILHAADLEDFRMRTPGGALFVDFYRTLGAKPRVVGLNALYKALSEHEVDGQDNPLVLIEERKLYEPCRYLCLSGHQWAGFNLIANNAFWQRLPEDIQEAVIRCAKAIVPEQRAVVRSANRALEQKLRAQGMLVSKVDTASFKRRLAGGFYARWRASTGSRAWALMEQETGPIG